MSDEDAHSEVSREDGRLWTEYYETFNQRLMDGGRALETISGRAVDTSDELDFHPDPHPLFVGGQKPHADRLEPQKTKKCDNATMAGTSRRATGRAKEEAAGRGGDEFHIFMLASLSEIWAANRPSVAAA